ncbi:MAG: hypothetical protein RL020_71 [Pseudomonadota bacterium]|jgi:hypothetical protein
MAVVILRACPKNLLFARSVNDGNKSINIIQDDFNRL